MLVVFAIGSIGLQTTPTCQACFDLFLCSQMCTVASHGRQMPKARLSQSSRPLQCSKLRHNTPAQHSCEVHDLDCIILYYIVLYCIQGFSFYNLCRLCNVMSCYTCASTSDIVRLGFTNYSVVCRWLTLFKVQLECAVNSVSFHKASLCQ